MTRNDTSELPPNLQDLLTLDAQDGPAPPLDGPATDALIGGALSAWQAPPAVPARRRRGGRVVLLAALTLGAGAAAAHYIASEGFLATRSAEGVAAPVETARAPRLDVAPPPPEPAQEVVTAERATRDLLARANRLRGAGRYAAAAATYLEAEQSAPSPQIAQVAQVAAADLQLERLDDPEQALALYEKAAATRGSLQPEAKVGVARALQALGKIKAGRRILHTLQDDRPHSPGAHRAAEQRRGE